MTTNNLQSEQVETEFPHPRTPATDYLFQRAEAEKLGISFEDMQELKQRGYTLTQRLGSGATRDVYLAHYQSGNVSKTRVIKIPKPEVITVTARINRAKKDLELEEVNISNQIHHPNVVEIDDSFLLNGRTVNAEPYVPATDLESLIRNTGPIRGDERLVKIFGQALEGAVYLEEKGILHRDIKPSNMLMLESGEVKISDLQTATFVNRSRGRSLPTKGGTPFTHPSILNSLVSDSIYADESGRATKTTEVYSLGASLYYLMTGENPFDYSVVEDLNGKEVEVNGQKFRLRLRNSKENLENITIPQHEEKLKEALKKVPKKYRDLLHRCLSLYDQRNKTIYSAKHLRDEFQRVAAKGFGEKLKEKLLVGSTVIPGVALASILLGGLGLFGYYHPRQETPTIKEILDPETYSKVSLEGVLDSREFADVMTQVSLEPYIQYAREHLPEIDEGIKRVPWGGNKGDFEALGKRLTYSWLRSCALHSKEASEHYKFRNQKRLFPSFVPDDFVFAASMKMETPKLHLGNDASVLIGASYLKQMLQNQRNVGEAFSHYFCSDVEVSSAQLHSGSVHLLPYKFQQGASTGYHRKLTETGRKLTLTALGLHLITDDNGEIHWDRFPKLSVYDKDIMEKRLYGGIR